MLSFMKKYKLLVYIFISITAAIIIGINNPPVLFVDISSVLNKISSAIISFFVPLMVIAFVTQGIVSIEKSSGKILGLVIIISYIFMLIAGFCTCVVALNVFSSSFGTGIDFNISENIERTSLLTNLPKLELKPLFSVIPAIVLAFVFGIGINITNAKTLKNIVSEFHKIIEIMVKKVIMTILPIYVFGAFIELAYSGKMGIMATTFYKVFIVEVLSHLFWIFIQFIVAGIFTQKNIFKLLKNIIPVYLTAFATRSSIATIPASLEGAEKNGVSNEVSNFAIPLSSSIHLTGSIISVTTSTIAVMMFYGYSTTFWMLVPYIFTLAMMMIAAPGVPCGVILSVTSLLVSALNFSPPMVSLMIALHVFQDGFGTACNVSGDNAIAVIVDKFYKKRKISEIIKKI